MDGLLVIDWGIVIFAKSITHRDRLDTAQTHAQKGERRENLEKAFQQHFSFFSNISSVLFKV